MNRTFEMSAINCTFRNEFSFRRKQKNKIEIHWSSDCFNPKIRNCIVSSLRWCILKAINLAWGRRWNGGTWSESYLSKIAKCCHQTCKNHRHCPHIHTQTLFTANMKLPDVNTIRDACEQWQTSYLSRCSFRSQTCKLTTAAFESGACTVCLYSQHNIYKKKKNQNWTNTSSSSTVWHLQYIFTVEHK